VSADQFIAARVSPETKARLRELADRQHLSESRLLRRLVELLLPTAAVVPTMTASSGTEAPRTARLMIRLRADDQILLRERAAARGMAPATYVSVLTRAHLRSHDTPLPKEELLGLKRCVAELGIIGRNLNQIARAANQGQLASKQPRPRRP
jgi:hypothetical protein